MASASAGLLCLIVILLYIFTQYFLNPEELRTDPQYQSTRLPGGPRHVRGSCVSLALQLSPAVGRGARLPQAG